MNQPLLTFQRFNDIGLANEFAEKLTELGIYCEIDNQTVPFDVTYANNPLENDIRIKLHPGDFTKANAVLDEYYKSQLDSIDKDYYLFSFTDNELEEIVRRPDEWNRLDYQLALKLLKDRGIEIKPEVIESYQQRRIAVLSQSEKSSVYWILAGYITPLTGIITGFRSAGLMFVMPGALTGIIIGALLMFSKKTLPNGTRVSIYTKNAQKHGKIILAISITSFLFWYVGIMTGLVFKI